MWVFAIWNDQAEKLKCLAKFNFQDHLPLQIQIENIQGGAKFLLLPSTQGDSFNQNLHEAQKVAYLQHG